MSESVEAFITRWKPSSGSEMANFQSFANELTDLLGVDRPKPATSDGENNDYRFERPVTFTHTGRKSRGRIDLYKTGCFVLEAKQGGDRIKPEDQDQLALLTQDDAPKVRLGHGPRGTAKWDDTMLKARNQADGYARAVSKEDGWPPFLMIVDVGHVIELFADFSRAGQGYTQFPDGNRYRIKLDDLRKEETRTLLRSVWTKPQSLDPSLVAAKVTRKIAAHLAELGKSFEAQGHDSETVARFLMRCLFSMFAEDVELIPEDSFTNKLKELRDHPEDAAPTLQDLWETMNTGGFSAVLATKLKEFNGGLFKDADALPLNDAQLGLLIEAADADWKLVEPAIFGTLLERALDKRQRHKLGAHYTPRAYVERLVMPTIMEPLRADWKDVQTAVQRLTADGKEGEAREAVHDFHRKLCETKVLDPACGSGNFLYVALEMMKRLEGEVTALLTELGENQATLGLSGHTVDPHQFLGIELNPWAAAVAELVLWIGYLQWHFRTHGTAAPSEPVLKDFRNIENRDAVLEWSDRKPRLDEAGDPITVWDKVTTFRHPVTGKELPDVSAREPVFEYMSPKATVWPNAEFIVGNPPFIGSKNLREDLGDGYIEALWSAYPKVPPSADLVMFWWDKAALAARDYNSKNGKGTRRFGLITTNSLRQTYNRRVLEPHLNDPKKPISLLFAIPDHPWVDTLYGAAVRISMTVVGKGERTGVLFSVATEKKEKNEAEGCIVTFQKAEGKIYSNLQIGPNLSACVPLRSNLGLAHQGFKPYGLAFWVDETEAHRLGYGVKPDAEKFIRPYINGRELNQVSRNRFALDFHEKSESFVRDKFPEAYQHLLESSKPVRAEDKMKYRREKWWRFGQPSTEMRAALEGLPFFFGTTETAAHRIFSKLDGEAAPDQKIRVIACSDWAIFSVLCSRVHVEFSFRTGGWQGKGNDPVYQHTNTFNKFPFPALEEIKDDLIDELRNEGQKLDQFRRKQIVSNPGLTLTGMYNVLEALRVADNSKDYNISADEREVYRNANIAILKQHHDRIDKLVFQAYGWGDIAGKLIGRQGATKPHQLKASDQKNAEDELMYRLVSLNKERTAEEAAGHIRWLRPDYQNPEGKHAEAKGNQNELDVGAAVKVEKEAWPKALPEQIAAVREVLEEMGEATPQQIARRFQRARTASVEPLLASLAALGQAQLIEDGRYAA
ncbi:class I SAM-dependent DNA methyltransferase [Hoeflea sp. G2-23]|uniref:site-specific DNA-methyltransferase (adenine-specific) n=1 Tax=Hoeflea algicola TaxID=2983763 RepID=A0ABT3ZA58_9HYPH|nr:DNA methyltransferase [Hoeflea algicola]MCY0148672.1 class I SAM-dependent DNA methyltransferase [Hoeflea algicola]